jgi:hypothetical protein
MANIDNLALVCKTIFDERVIAQQQEIECLKLLVLEGLWQSSSEIRNAVDQHS